VYLLCLSKSNTLEHEEAHREPLTVLAGTVPRNSPFSALITRVVVGIVAFHTTFKLGAMVWPASTWSASQEAVRTGLFENLLLAVDVI
jgi:hypothetical protein